MPAVHLEAFSLRQAEHLHLISTATQTYIKRLEKLKQLHTKMAAPLGFALLSVVASPYIMGWLLWEGVKWGCLIQAGSNYKELTQSVEEYKEAFSELLGLYQWALKPGDVNMHLKLRNQTIQNLITTLGPSVSSQTIAVWNDEDIKPKTYRNTTLHFQKTTALLSETFNATLTDLRLGKQELTAHFHIYGEHVRGDVLAVAKRSSIQLVKAAGELAGQYTPDLGNLRLV